jgi:hypothetical protein
MKLWKLYAVALAALLVGGACMPQGPTQPGAIVITNNNTNQNGSGGGASPSPSPGTCSVASVRVGFFGFGPEAACAGLRNGGGVLKVGCSAAGTATPKLADGTDAPAAAHGPQIEWAILANEQAIRFAVQDNPFNYEAFGLAAAPTVVIQATVHPPGCAAITGQQAFAVTQ